jgi:hypothetical protein
VKLKYELRNNHFKEKQVENLFNGNISEENDNHPLSYKFVIKFGRN